MNFLQIIWINVLGIAIISLFFYQNVIRNYEKQVKRTIAGLIIFVEFIYQSWAIYTGYWKASFDLPFHLCSGLQILSVYVLLSGKHTKMMNFLRYILIVGPMFAILFPFVSPNVPVHYTYFFIYHILLVLTGVWYFVINKLPVSLKDVFYVVSFIHGMALIASVANFLTGGNYMFTVKPFLQLAIFDKNILLYYAFAEIVIWVCMGGFYFLIRFFNKKDESQLKTKERRHSLGQVERI